MRWRTVGRVAVTALVGLLVPVAVAAVGIAGATGEIYTPRDASAPPQLSGPAWPWALTLRPVLIAAAAVAGALIIQLLLRRRREQIDADQVVLGDETKSRQGGIDVTAGRS